MPAQIKQRLDMDFEYNKLQYFDADEFIGKMKEYKARARTIERYYYHLRRYDMFLVYYKPIKNGQKVCMDSINKFSDITHTKTGDDGKIDGDILEDRKKRKKAMIYTILKKYYELSKNPLVEGRILFPIKQGIETILANDRRDEG